MNSKILCLFAAIASYGISAHADGINRCVAADGKISYSDVPCPASAKNAAEIHVKPTVPTTESKESEAPKDWQVKEAEFQKRRSGQQTAMKSAEQKAQDDQALKILAKTSEWPAAQEKARQLEELRRAVRQDRKAGRELPARYYENISP